MASGGVRFDFTEEDAFTHHENRTIRLPILDADGAFVDDIDGSEWNFFIFDALKDNRDTLGAGAVITKLDAVIDQTVAAVEGVEGTGPCIDIPIEPDDTAGMKSKPYWFEAYRVDTGNQTRVSYGIWPLID